MSPTPLKYDRLSGSRVQGGDLAVDLHGMEARRPSQKLKERALSLGFQTIGVADAVAPPHLPAYRTWIDKGFQGTMAYLADHLPLKEHPDRLLPGARSVVAVTLNYNQSVAVEPGRPRVARYAWGRD